MVFVILVKYINNNVKTMPNFIYSKFVLSI
jgi:hypothetical protein